MKFTIKNEPQEPKEVPVELSLDIDGDGDVRLCANGNNLLWIKKEGWVLFNSSKSDQFRQLGFMINSEGDVDHD